VFEEIGCECHSDESCQDFQPCEVLLSFNVEGLLDENLDECDEGGLLTVRRNDGINILLEIPAV